MSITVPWPLFVVVVSAVTVAGWWAGRAGVREERLLRQLAEQHLRQLMLTVAGTVFRPRTAVGRVAVPKRAVGMRIAGSDLPPRGAGLPDVPTLREQVTATVAGQQQAAVAVLAGPAPAPAVPEPDDPPPPEPVAQPAGGRYEWITTGPAPAGAGVLPKGWMLRHHLRALRPAEAWRWLLVTAGWATRLWRAGPVGRWWAELQTARRRPARHDAGRLLRRSWGEVARARTARWAADRRRAAAEVQALIRRAWSPPARTVLPALPSLECTP